MIVKDQYGKYIRAEKVGDKIYAFFDGCVTIECAMAEGHITGRTEKPISEWEETFGYTVQTITPETLSRGDVMVGGTARERMVVQGRMGEIVFFIINDNQSRSFTEKLLKENMDIKEDHVWLIEQPHCDKCGK